MTPAALLLSKLIKTPAGTHSTPVHHWNRVSLETPSGVSAK